MKTKTSSNSLITIGQLSELSGISKFTLRYYVEQELLQVETRTDSNYKLFNSESALKQIEFIKKAQRINFSLDEIKSLLDVRGKNHPCDKVRLLLAKKINDIEERLQEFTKMKSFLSEVQGKWSNMKNCSFSDESNYSICKLIENVDSIPDSKS